MRIHKVEITLVSMKLVPSEHVSRNLIPSPNGDSRSNSISWPNDTHPFKWLIQFFLNKIQIYSTDYIKCIDITIFVVIQWYAVNLRSNIFTRIFFVYWHGEFCSFSFFENLLYCMLARYIYCLLRSYIKYHVNLLTQR